MLDASDAGRCVSDPLIDRARLEGESRLAVYYPGKGSPNAHVLDCGIA